MNHFERVYRNESQKVNEIEAVNDNDVDLKIFQLKSIGAVSTDHIGEKIFS